MVVKLNASRREWRNGFVGEDGSRFRVRPLAALCWVAHQIRLEADFAPATVAVANRA
jgi:hypothetical protein